MEITFFGSYGAVPVRESGNVSFAVQGHNYSILVDVSGNPLQSLLKAKINPMELYGVVLTHAHTDHYYALPSLIHTLWMMKRKKELVFFTNPDTEKKAKELLSLFGLLTRPGLFPLRFLTLSGQQTLSVGTTIELFPVRHSVSTSGILLAEENMRLLYTADTMPFPNLQDYGNAEVVIHEASGLSAEEEVLNAAGHSSARQAGTAAGRLHAKVLFLCHAPSRKGIVKKLVAEAEKECGETSVLYPKIFFPYRTENLVQTADETPEKMNAVVFDFDGTLIDTMAIKVKNFVDSVLQIFKLPSGTSAVLASVFTEMAGANRFAQLEGSFQKLGIPLPPENRIQKWSDLYSALNKKAIAAIREFSSVRTVLSGIKQNGYSVFLTSGILDDELKTDIKRRKLAGLFDGIQGGDKEAFLNSIKQKGYTYICFVGDTEYDRSISVKSGTDFFHTSSDKELRLLKDYLLEKKTAGKILARL